MMNLHNEIALSLAKLHLLLESGAKGIKWVSSWSGLKPVMLVKSVLSDALENISSELAPRTIRRRDEKLKHLPSRRRRFQAT